MLNLKQILGGLSEEQMDNIIGEDIRAGWNKSRGRCSSKKSKKSKSKKSKSKKSKSKKFKIKSSKKSSKSSKSSKSH